MSGKNKLKIVSAASSDLFGVCENFHALVNRVYAGGNKGTSALNLNHAYTAGSDLVELFHIAKCGYINSAVSCRLEDGDSVGHAQGHAVNFNIYHFHNDTLLPLFL